MAKAVVADGAQSCGQHLPQIAADELDARQRQSLGSVVVGPVFPAEGDGVLINRENARVGDGGASHVSAEILEGGDSGACRLDMDSPIFTPHLRIHLPALFLKEAIEVLAKGALQVG